METKEIRAMEDEEAGRSIYFWKCGLIFKDNIENCSAQEGSRVTEGLKSGMGCGQGSKSFG